MTLFMRNKKEGLKESYKYNLIIESPSIFDAKSKFNVEVTKNENVTKNSLFCHYSILKIKPCIKINVSNNFFWF
jgi:hypothetical protein